MKISLDQHKLASVLNIVQKAVSGRPTHPILGNILIDAKKDTVQITGFDLSLMIQVNLETDVEEIGKITLPGKLFGDIINRLSSEKVYLEFKNGEENPMVKIESENGKYKLRGTSADEYPEVLLELQKNIITYPAHIFADGLKRTLFATSNDDSKQILQGVNIQQTKNEIKFASTDGHRLAYTSIEHEKDDNLVETALTIPNSALKEIEKIIGIEKADEIQLFIENNSQLVFSIGNYIISSRKFDGAFPNYPQLIPKTFEKTMIVNRKKLLAAVEQVSVLSDQKNTLVKFDIDKNNQNITISVNAKELGNAKTTIDAEITSEESITIGFNIKYLSEGLKALETTDIKFNLNSPVQPVILNPLGSIVMTYLIMPVNIKE